MREKILSANPSLAVILLLLPQVIPGYHITLVQIGLAMAILALGINLLLRYTGVLSFGHGGGFSVYGRLFILITSLYIHKKKV